jgi:glycosyltransferase involved in cell wall biosynthesis
MLSVVTPAYTEARRLPATLARLHAHLGGREHEILVVDDGSTDATAQIAAGFDGVRVVASGGAGLIASLNLGIESARGELIARLDADDWYLPRGLARLVDTALAHPDVDLVAGGAVEVDASGRRLGLMYAPVDERHLAYQLMAECPITHSAVLYRRRSVLAVGGYGCAMEGWAEDYALWSRMVSAGQRMRHVPELVTVREIRAGRVSDLHLESQAQMAEMVRRKAAEYWVVDDRMAARVLDLGRDTARHPGAGQLLRDHQFRTLRVARATVRSGDWRRGIRVGWSAMRLGPVRMIRSMAVAWRRATRIKRTRGGSSST